MKSKTIILAAALCGFMFTVAYAQTADTVYYNGSILTMGDIISTKMAGPPELMKLESEYAKTMASVDGFHVHGDELELLSKGAVVANFSAKP